MGDWRSLSDWEKARFRWLLETELHPTDPRSDQVVPEAQGKRVLLYSAGRGWGKTRVGAEDVSDYARRHPGCRLAVVAATWHEARDVCMEGESGILSIVPASCIKDWNRSHGQLTFTNGARVDLYTAEKPGGLRGPQHHRAWADELAKWHYMETWDQLQFGLRLGDNPQTVVTTTPRPIQMLRDLIASPTTLVTQGTTFDNARNLPAAQLEFLRNAYEGSRFGRQELYAEILDDYEGALWTRAAIDDHRITDAPTEVRAKLAHLGIVRVMIGIDPSTWSPELGGTESESAGHGLETGIVAVGIDGRDPPHLYVLDDLSCRARPEQWARTAADAFHFWEAAALVPETNMGGPMVLATIRLTDPNVTLYRQGNRVGVHAAQGKRARAEPIATLYEQGRVHHVGHFVPLESELCGWDPTESWSPDRLDALVWACVALNPAVAPGADVIASAVAKTRVPGLGGMGGPRE